MKVSIFEIGPVVTRNRLVIRVLMLSLLLSGCGGLCSYEKFPGMLEVVSIKDGEYRLLFELRNVENKRSQARTYVPLERLNGWATEVPVTDPRFASAVVGDRFHADASVMTGGACTPVIFEIGGKAGVSP